MYTSAVCSRVALAKASFKQADAPPHEIGEYERTLNAHLADNRDGTEWIRVTLGDWAMTQDEVDSDAQRLEFWNVAQGGRHDPRYKLRCEWL